MTTASERCPRCGVPTLTSTRDVLGDVAVQARLDPTPLSVPLQVACVVADRPLWRHGVEAGQHVVGRALSGNADRRIGAPDDVLPAHACRGQLAPAAAWFANLDGVRWAYQDMEVPF